LIAWIGCVALFGFILGVVSESVSSAGISDRIRNEIAKLGSGSILTPSGYLAFVFLFFVFVLSLFACAQIGATRHEEAEQRLETLLALPLSRYRWLGGRLLVAVAGASVIALGAGLFTWAGAVVVGVDVSLGRMLEAGVNCLPSSLLFLGLAALAYAVWPRASSAVGYGLVILAFFWQLVGSLLGAPHWLTEVTPFAHVGLVPVEAFRPGAALVMLAVGLAAASASLGCFRRRDLLGA
jgi:ABC-2 type transport system permease protein